MTQTQIIPNNSYVIIFNDQSKKFISQNENDYIYSQIEKNVAGFTLGDTYIRFSSIARLLSLQDFYSQYPKERPQNSTIRDFTGLGMDSLINSAKGKALEGMIKGLENYINSTEENPIVNKDGMKSWYQGTKAPLELLEKMKQKALTNKI